jgi:arsenate reductase-like glutaredoxin family protein
VLQGVQGDGKSLFAEMMQHVLGFNNVRIMNVQSLESSFTGWAEGQCMTFIEELKLDNYRKYEVLNNLKPYITNETIEVTKKGKDPRVVINTTNYFALTNFKDALPIDENDRRYCVLFSQWQQSEKLVEFMENNPGYYSELYNDMRLGAGELLDWLSNHKISEVFLAAKRAPLTKAKESMQLLSKSDDHLIVDDAIHEFECSDINENTLNITKLQKLVSTEGNISDYEHFPKTSRLKNILTDMGYHFIGVHKNKDRKNQRLYNKDPSIDLNELLEQISDYEDDEI